MSEKQKEILAKLAEEVPKMDPINQARLLGMAEGMALASEQSKRAKGEDKCNEETTTSPDCTALS